MTEELEKLIGDIAVKGAHTPGVDGWRAAAACRQIAELLNRKVPKVPALAEVLKCQ